MTHANEKRLLVGGAKFRLEVHFNLPHFEGDSLF